jgi:carboxyl-terminal processing protease
METREKYRGSYRVLRRISFAAIFFWLLLSYLPFAATTRVFRSYAATSDAAAISTTTREGRLAVFDDAWTTINQRYYDSRFQGLANGLTWDAQRTIFRSLAAQANSSQEFYDVLRRMIVSLNDPHTRVFAPDERFDWWRPRFVSIGLAIREIEGQPTVVEVDRDSAPHRAGIRAGDVVEAVNGEFAMAAVNKLLIASARTSSRLRAVASLTQGPLDASVEIRWKGKNEVEKVGRFNRYWRQRDLGLRVRREKGEIAVIEIDAFTKPIAAAFAQALKEKLKGARGIILDLRSNGGGDAEAMADVASAFLGGGFALGQFIDRSGTPFAISTYARSLHLPERIEQTKLPLVVLSSERTSSAAEIFIAALKASGRAKVVGSETCGCVLAIRHRHTLPDGGLLDVSELDYQTASGERLEKLGVKPDVTIEVERRDLYSNRDRAVEYSIRKLLAISPNRTVAAWP